MKRVLLVALAATVGCALAQPFVWPNEWSADPEEATSGGSVRWFTLGNPRTFNPFTSAESTADRDLVMLQGASLLTYPPDSDELIPYAASSVEISEDGLTIDMTLRDGIKWSDGTDVTVQDYMFRYEAETDVDVGSNAYDGYFIEGEQILLEVTGENTLRWTFPVSDRTALTQAGSLQPAPDHILGGIYREGGAEALREAWGTDTDPSETVWTSPFIPTSYTSNERIILTRNPTFGEWNQDEAGNPLPYLDEVNFTIVGEGGGDAALNLYVAGQLDIFAPRSLDDIGVINVAVQNGDIDATVLESVSPQASSSWIVFNWNQASDPFKEELFRNATFRQAMSHLMDREAMTELVYGGAASPMYSNVYQVLDFWVNEDITRFDYDPEAAAELLASIGFSERNSNGFLVNDDGQELAFTIATNAGNQPREQMMQIFVDTAREAGVNVQPRALDFNLLVDQLLSEGEDRPFDAILLGLVGGARDWPFGQNVIPCGTNLHAFNGTPECLTPEEELADRLYFEGRRELDTDAAREIGYQIQEAYAEMQAFIYLVSPSYHVSYSNRVGGAHPEEIINSIAGSRQFQLTYIRD